MNSTIDKIKELKNLNEKTDLKHFGKQFQIKVLKLMIKDKALSYRIIPILKSEYFNDIYIRGVYDLVKKYINDYNRNPSFDNLEIIINNEYEKPKAYLNVLQEIEKVDLDDRDFVVENLENFCFRKHAEINLEDALRKIRNGEFDKAQSIAYDTFKFSGGNTTKIYSAKKNMDMVFDEEKVINPLPTIFPTFNDNMQGGPGSGKLVILVAGSNFGKTNALVATARRLNEDGKTVVLFSFEIGGSEVFRRHFAGMVDEKQADVKYAKTNVKEILSSSTYGDFIIVEEKATKARISTIKHNLNFLKSQGIFPDVILVDGLNQLKLPEGMRYEGDNRMFEYLAEELRDLAKEEELPIYTVFQGNRCLAPETKVNILNKGEIEIKDALEGDYIETPFGYKKITEKWENKSQPMYRIKLKDGREIICSDKHDFPTSEGLKNIANGLSKGNKLFCKLDSLNLNEVEIESIELIAEMSSVDICVEDVHAFYANGGILTHNSSFKNEINDEQSIGKAIEPLQVSDALIFFSQTPEMANRGVCYANLLKNRMGRKNILLEAKYDPDKCIFEEIGEVNPKTNVTDEQARKIISTATKFIRKQ